MKIWIENASAPIDQLAGKSLFCRRLADELRRRDVDVTGDADATTDVSLNVIRIKHQKSRKKILRLNGVWHDTGKPWRAKNRVISASMRAADGVVYQSRFAKAMCEKYLGKPACPTRVILNGSDVAMWRKTRPAKLPFRNTFIAFSKWRPHKRLRDIIYSFIDAEISESQLLTAGDTARSDLDDYEKEIITSPGPNSAIRHLGRIPQSELMPIVKACTASVHLCWFDACPNSVVEAVCAGVPVICNNVGGTPEIVGPSGGWICGIDKLYDLEPVDLYNPPGINREVVAEAMRLCVASRPEIRSDHVDIRNTATQYLEFMEGLL